ncbi:MAG TPA: LysM peptidoglycan-binding domain-containing protein, partial [Saprospiraceae bacterium]|nr:LysM peptidoglycan-binding domain-containing protein [Saprospiraceae bacterium]
LQAQINTTFPARQKFIHYAEPNGFVMIEAIEPGMTLYSLSRKYNIGIDSILAVNPDLDPQAIPLGYPVNIPLCSKAITFHEPSEPDAEIPLYYRVQPKETMYRISKVYLNASPEIILGLNPLASINLSIGQVLLLGWYSPGRNTHNPATSINSSPIDSTSFHVKNYEEDYKTQGKIIVEQKGLAVWKPGNDKTHYFVLHPTALVGSIMEVTNPMLHRTLTAKVAGHIPPGLYPTNVGLVVSPSVARALGVLDQQFFAKWRFVE